MVLVRSDICDVVAALHLGKKVRIVLAYSSCTVLGLTQRRVGTTGWISAKRSCVRTSSSRIASCLLESTAVFESAVFVHVVPCGSSKRTASLMCEHPPPLAVVLPSSAPSSIFVCHDLSGVRPHPS